MMTRLDVLHFGRAGSLTIALLGAMLLGGCQGGGSTEQTKTPGTSETSGTASSSSEPIVIAVAAPFTGNSSEYGVKMRMGAELARDQINAAGGINGRQVELKTGDDAGNPAEAQNVATKIATDPAVVAVVGHFNSSCSLAAKDAYGQAKLVMFSPGSTNVTVTKDSNGYVYRNIFTDDFQGQSLADYAGPILGFKKVAILFDNDDYGTGLKESFKKRAAELGLQIVAEAAYDRETNDFRSQLETIRSSSPEIILVAGLYKAAGVVAKQARELGINTQLIGGDGLFAQQFIDLGGQASEGAFVTCPFLFELGGERAKAFADAYRKKYNQEPDAWAALTYDAVNMIVDGVKKHGVSREAVRDYLSSINSPEKAYAGLTGRTYFDKEGNSRKPVQVATVKGGKFVKADKQLPEAPVAKPATGDASTSMTGGK